jgi:lipid A disaccharide synthetase
MLFQKPIIVEYRYEPIVCNIIELLGQKKYMYGSCNIGLAE